MTGRRKTVAPPPDPVPDESWIPVQVAAVTGIPYQRARNMMLERVFGEPTYDAITRKLTVKSSLVLAYVAKHPPRVRRK